MSKSIEQDHKVTWHSSQMQTPVNRDRYLTVISKTVTNDFLRIYNLFSPSLSWSHDEHELFCAYNVDVRTLVNAGPWTKMDRETCVFLNGKMPN